MPSQPLRPTAPPPLRPDNPGVKPALTFLKNLSTLQLALALSVAVHAVLLTVRFVDPEGFNRAFQDTPLEVILVNARTLDQRLDKQPDPVQAIAQATLAGGGEADAGRATSPLPPSLQARMGDTIEEDERRIESLKERQNQVLAQVRQQLANLPPLEKNAQSTDKAIAEREQQRQALINMLAEIERRINEENARPKRRYISPATREEVYAIYYDALRRKIEERGTSNFPQVKGRKLYGELTMVITVQHSGKVLSTEVVHVSGNPTLDRQAEAIVRGLEFGRFNEAMRKRADEIVVVSRFRFTRDETLRTQLTSQ
ncbi:MAG: hypothetical protein RLZZ352_1825 [Pseudomonadota bacterium]